MANQAPTYFVTKFTDQVEFLTQQMPARFWDASDVRTYEGSGAVATEQVGATVMQVVTGRVEPVTITDTPAARRWIYQQKYQVSDVVDTFEKLEMAIDPDGWIAKDFTFAMNRQKDDVWIANYFGNAYTGNTSTTGNAPSTTVAFPAAQIVAVTVGSTGGATAVHFNVPKLRAARLGMLQNEVDLTYDAAYAGLSAIQLDDMLNQAQAISMDFQDKPVLQDGQITRFMGYEFIHTERLPITSDGNSYRMNPIWVKSGVRAGVWKDNTTNIFQADWLVGRPWMISSILQVGATRLQEVKCWQILSKEN